jgi:hypothetical protein
MYFLRRMNDLQRLAIEKIEAGIVPLKSQAAASRTPNEKDDEQCETVCKWFLGTTSSHPLTKPRHIAQLARYLP